MKRARGSVRQYCRLLILLLVVGTLRGFAATPQPIQWTLSASVTGSQPMKKGASAVATLHAVIQRGWHLYALDQEPGGPIATKISLPARQSFVLDGDVDQPTPMVATDPNFNLETHFYEDHVTFTLPLKVTAQLRAGPNKVSVDVLYQTCNDTMCLPPTVVHLTSLLKQ
jgi:DsbC/DsbD-like thiol-disulfide interchange protein